MAKLIKAEDLGTYLKKKQGSQTDQAFADQLGITRVTLRALKQGRNFPKPRNLSKFGLKLVYRVVEESIPVAAAAPAKKAATKKAVK